MIKTFANLSYFFQVSEKSQKVELFQLLANIGGHMGEYLYKKKFIIIIFYIYDHKYFRSVVRCINTDCDSGSVLCFCFFIF